MQRALLAGVLVALVCALVGVFLVMRRMSLLGDGLAHISFGGIAFGLFFKIYPIFSALLFAIAASFGIQKLKNLKVYGDAAIAIFFSFGLALGVVLISYSKGFGLDLFSYLFGSILAVSETDILVIFTIGAVAFAAVLVFYKELLYITFDEDAAKASGIPVERMNMMLVLLTAIIVVLSMRIVGILLVSSFLVIPASTALLFRKSFKETVIYASLFSVFSVILGLISAYYFDLAAGGAIVLVLVLIFASVLLYRQIASRK